MTSPNCPVRGYLVGLQHRATSPAPLRLAAQSVPPSSYSPLTQCGLFTPPCDTQLGYFKDISEPGFRGLSQLSRPGWTLQSQIESASALLPAWRHDSKPPILLLQTFLWDEQGPSYRLKVQTSVAILARNIYPEQEAALAEIATLGEFRALGGGIWCVSAIVRHCNLRCAFAPWAEAEFCSQHRAEQPAGPKVKL